MSSSPRRHSPYPARIPEFLEHWSRRTFVRVVIGAALATLVLGLWNGWFWWLALPVAAFGWVGYQDMTQTRHSIRRNFPVLGHARYFLESLRPEIRQYFVESDHELNPFSREQRSIVYQRAKDQLDTQPFGTRQDVTEIGYEWLEHSLQARPPRHDEVRIPIGDGDAAYSASLLNVSAMSYGSLGRGAIEALNRGARLGQFFHNSGEGGVSPYHLEPGGDVCWQIGTGYFGCRGADGGFDEEKFLRTVSHPNIKLIEVKLSQGAKPGHGGILPAKKVTEEIARIRGVPMGQDVLSPPAHSAFSDPIEMVQFLARLRELSGKPVGFKLCVGRRVEFLSIVRAMLETGLTPDFIAVDGGEGGTGAAPLEFANSMGAPLQVGLSFVHDALVGTGLRDRIRVISSGKITSGFHVVQQLALGADLCNSARGMMFALGCIQALKCNTNHCPVGIATQDPNLTAGLVVSDKATRVHLFQKQTVESVYDLLGAAGLEQPGDLRRAHIFRRVDHGKVLSYAEIYPEVEEEALLQADGGGAPANLLREWNEARADRF